MTTMEPTPEQLAGWLHLWECNRTVHGCSAEYNIENTARLAYAAGADAELEASATWIGAPDAGGTPQFWEDLEYRLRRYRRPKPPSLKQQAMEAFRRRYPERIYINDGTGSRVEVSPELFADLDRIERALESLPDD
jgi:hypothetical protein